MKYKPYKIKPNVWCLDTGYKAPQMAAAYLLFSDTDLGLFDCGTNTSAPLLLEQIESLGFSADQVVSLCLTHAHLDHAGGAGLLIDSLPNATVYAHQDTIKHLTNPTKLEQGVRHVYGDTVFDNLFGHIRPLAINRCVALEDNERCAIGNLEIQALYTPGHAWHHHAFLCEAYDVIMTGDAFGMFLPLGNPIEDHLLFPATPPTQFEPNAMIDSFRKIIALKVNDLLLTHYGCLHRSHTCINQLIDLVEQSVLLAQKHVDSSPEEIEEAWVKMYTNSLPSARAKQNKQWIRKSLLNDVHLFSAGAIHHARKQLA